jgi:Co/Zn/Cd efflux system component
MLLEIICGNKHLQAIPGAAMGTHLFSLSRFRSGKPGPAFLETRCSHWQRRRVANDSTSAVARLAIISLGVGLAVLALKVLAAWLTGSIALWSDALETVVNVLTAIVALVAVRLAARPADATLPYGYGKAEYFSAVVIGVIIALTSVLIF